MKNHHERLLALLLVPLIAFFVDEKVFAESTPAPFEWKQTGKLSAVEAHQAAAATPQHLFAITNSLVAKYDRESGKRLQVSQGEATHLNSGFVWDGKLFCAHSNYPKTPELSEIKVVDLESMQLSTFKNFGDFGGSLTWAVHHNGSWWCNFAKYGDANSRTFLVQFDTDWKEQARWTYPLKLIKQLGKMSLSGGLWRGNLLLVTGHDDGVIFRLRLPKQQDEELELVDQHRAPFTGQGIAIDPVNGGLVGIDRGRREIVMARLEVPTPLPRLPRDQLLIYRDLTGKQKPVTTADDWKHRRAEILRSMQVVMGPLPGEEKRCPLNVKLDEEVDCGSYVRRLISYESEPGSRVPAYLCVPKKLLGADGGKASAVLCLHGTDNTIGHGTVVGLGRANRQYASELADRGFVTIAPNYVLLAKYQPDVRGLGWESGTLKAVWDNMRAIDLLHELPYVQRNSIGAIGHSLGGHNAVYTAVFDERIQTVVSSCGLDSFLDYYDGQEKSWYPEKGWCQLRYMPRMAEYRGRLSEIPFDFHELVAAISPRRVLIIAPFHDSNFRHASVDRVAKAASEVFRLQGVADHLQVLHPDCPHDFPPEMREAAYKLLADHPQK